MKHMMAGVIAAATAISAGCRTAPAADREVEASSSAEGLDVLDWNGPDYKRVHAFGAWRIAYLNDGPRFGEKNFSWIERHMKTDEAFVLLEGEATLVIGRDKQRVPMARNKIYNVRKGVWHQILMKPGAKSLIIENDDTSKDNTEYIRW